MTWRVLDEFFCWQHREETGRRQADQPGGIKGSRLGVLRIPAGLVVAVGAESKAKWSYDRRADKPGDTFDLVPRFQSTLFLKMFKNDLSPITLLYANCGKYKKEKGGYRIPPPSRTTIDTLEYFLLLLFPMHLSFM